VSLDLVTRTTLVAALVLAACGSPPRETLPSRSPHTPARAPVRGPGEHHDLSELETPPRPKLLAIDWNTTRITSDADALALWSRFGLTGDDFHDKLEEIPRELHRALALALLREGNFTCVPARLPATCQLPVFDVPDPAPTATLKDPCLRRVLAMWAIERLEAEDVPMALDGLRGIVTIPPPESELTVAALKAIPDADQPHRLELVALAYQSGQRELANQNLGNLDEDHLDEAVLKHHIDGALEVLPASTHRATYLAAVADTQMIPKARIQAISELVTASDDKLGPDLEAALIKATATEDCDVAAAAARALVRHGKPKYAPKHPRTTSTAALMRAVCVLASYELMSGNDEASLLPSYVPARGLERMKVTYDALSDTDPDGDGDVHTERNAELVPRKEVVVPEVEDFVRAMRSCKGTTCSSEEHDFKLIWRPVGGELLLYRLEIVERPPCH